jgi:hypothetical protein
MTGRKPRIDEIGEEREDRNGSSFRATDENPVQDAKSLHKYWLVPQSFVLSAATAPVDNHGIHMMFSQKTSTVSKSDVSAPPVRKKPVTNLMSFVSFKCDEHEAEFADMGVIVTK